MTDSLRTVLWRSEALEMTEYCALADTGQAFQLAGVVLAIANGAPVRITYQVLFDWQGLTHSVAVDAAGGLGEQHIRLEADGQRAWRWNGRPLPECQGAADVDLGFTPATNTLPIRRMHLQEGESRAVSAAWVRFPEFDVVPFPQRYTRLSTDRYRYESLLSDFTAELLVDEHGIVRQYGQYWQAIAVS